MRLFTLALCACILGLTHAHRIVRGGQQHARASSASASTSASAAATTASSSSTASELPLAPPPVLIPRHEWRDVDITAGLGSTWYIGILLTLISCVIGTFGLLLSKSAHVYDSDLPVELQEPNIYRRPLAWAGIMVKAFMPTPLDTWALAFARNSLLVPFAALPVIFNMIGAWALFNERVGRIEIIGTFLVTFGCIVTTIFGNHHGARFTISGCPNEDVSVVNGTDTFSCACGPHAVTGYASNLCPGHICDCIELDSILMRPGSLIWLSFALLSVLGCLIFWECKKPKDTEGFTGARARGKSIYDTTKAANEREKPHWIFAYTFGYTGGTLRRASERARACVCACVCMYVCMYVRVCMVVFGRCAAATVAVLSVVAVVVSARPTEYHGRLAE